MERKRQPKKRRSNFGCLVFIIIICILSAFIYPKAKKQVDYYRYPIKYYSLVESAAEKYSLSSSLVFAVILTESSFVPDAVSHAGAKGLMQITDDTNDWIAFKLREPSEPERIFEPERNVERGCFLLSYLIEEFGSTEVALAAYNAGIGRVRSWLADSRYSDDNISLRDIPYPETKKYVESVLESAEMYAEIYNLE